MTSRGKRWPATRLSDSAVAWRPQPPQAKTTRPCASWPSRVRSDEEQRGHEDIVPTLRDQLTPGQCRRTEAQAALEAAMRRAEQLNTRMDIAVVDAGANLRAFVRQSSRWRTADSNEPAGSCREPSTRKRKP